MLSADVPEFIPKALRSVEHEQAANNTVPDEKDKKDNVQEENIQQPPDVNEDINLPTDHSYAADVSTQNANPPDPEVAPLTSTTEERDLLNSYPESSLSATSAEFVPSGEYSSNLYYGYGNQTDSPTPHIPYPPPNTPYVFPHKSGNPYEPNNFPMYYCDQPWNTEMDYSGYFQMVNGAYSGGEYFVPDGGYIYDSRDGYGGMIMGQGYYDSGMRPDMVAGQAMNAGGGRGRGGQFRRQNRGRNNRRPPDQGGGRGRQPTTAISICGQTGELTYTRRKSGSLANDCSKISSKDSGHASSILNNVSNWPGLGKSENADEALAKMASSTEEGPSAAAAADPSPLNFSLVAKKNDTSLNGPTVAESHMESDKAPAKQKKINRRKSNSKKQSSISSTDDNSSPQTIVPQSSNDCKTQLADTLQQLSSDLSKDRNESASEPCSDMDSNATKSSIENWASLSKSARKRAKRNLKKQHMAASDQGKVMAVETVTADDKASSEPASSKEVIEPVVKPTPVTPTLRETQTVVTPKDNSKFSVKDERRPLVPSNTDKSTGKKTKTPSQVHQGNEKNSAFKEQPCLPVSSPVKSPKKEEPKESEWVTVVRGKTRKNGTKDSQINLQTANDMLVQDKENENSEFPEKKNFARKNSKESLPLSKENSSTNVPLKNKEIQNGSKRVTRTPKIKQTISSEQSKNCVDTLISEESNLKNKPPDEPPPKSKDPNDPKVQELKKQRALKKEMVKQQKRLNREQAALQKQAEARRDTKISLLSPPLKDNQGEVKQENFVMKVEEYPSLFDSKTVTKCSNVEASVSSAQKTSLSNPKNLKAELQKVNGIVRVAKNNASSEVGKQQTNKASKSVVSSDSFPPLSSADSSSSAAPSVLSYSAAASSTAVGKPPATNNIIQPSSESNKGSSSDPKKSKKSPLKKTVITQKTKKVKTSDKITIDFGAMLQVSIFLTVNIGYILYK